VIQLYARGFTTVTSAFGPLSRWARRHPRWATVTVIVFFYLLTLIFGNAYAYAADNSGTSLAPFLPGGNIIDSKGVALNQYAVLPLDRGDMLHYQKTIITSIVDFIWVGHLGAVAWMISFLDWLLSFEWVKWIAAPFETLATFISHFTGEINWIPFALMLTALVAFIAIAKGRYAGGFIEILLSCVCAVLAAGLLANPVASLTAAGGALDKAQGYGSGIAAAVVSDGGDTTGDGKLTGANIFSKSVTTQLADIFIRTPAQTIAFGHALTGNCDQVFTDTMKSDSPAAGGTTTVRDRVSDCDEEAKNYVQNPNMGSVATAGIISTGGGALFLFAMSIALLFIVTVFFFLIEAIKTQWNVLIGVLPVSRTGLWKSLMGMVMGLVSIIAMVVVMAAYLKILISILNATASLGIVQQMLFVNVVIIVLIVLLWRVRSAAKKAGISMAEQLSKLGLSTVTAKPRDRSMAIATMGQVANYAINRMNRPKSLPAMDNRSVNFYGSPTGSNANANSNASVDLGEMSSRTSAPVPRTSTTPVAQRAVTAPQVAVKAQKAASVVYTATKIAKAAPGGPGAMAGQAAISVGSNIVNKKTESTAKAIASRNTKAISAPTTSLPELREATQRPSAIVVDSKGVGHIQRNTPTSPVPPATAATKPAARSPRSIEMRQVLADTKTGQ
jgi:hypothetical protein